MNVIKKHAVDSLLEGGYVALMLATGSKVLATSNNGGVLNVWYEEEAEPLSGYRMPYEVHFCTKGSKVPKGAQFLNEIRIGSVTAMSYVVPPK